MINLGCYNRFSDCEIVRISGPLKKMYAEHHNLNWDELMSDSAYKEQYRKNMIRWSDQIRIEDPGYFCRAACKLGKFHFLNHILYICIIINIFKRQLSIFVAIVKKIWLISDVRRKTDIQWFKENYANIKTVRITANSQARKGRGWIFTEG